VLCLAVRFVQAQEALLGEASFRSVMQTSDASPSEDAGAALDGDTGTSSRTDDIPDSYWQVELDGTHHLTRIEVDNAGGRYLPPQMDGLVLRIFGMTDQTVFTTNLANPGPGATWSVDLPDDTRGRAVRIGLEDGQPNGRGLHVVALVEVRLFGYTTESLGPIDLEAHAEVGQSSTNGSYVADLALDGDPGTATRTESIPNSSWFAALDHGREIRQIEIVNSRTADARLAGLVLRILDDSSNTVATTTIANPGAGATWAYDPPPGTTGRYVRVGLENGAKNGYGDYCVSLAEFNIFASTNLAVNKHSYMVRYLDSVSPASRANDGNYATESKTTDRTVDGYWEVDLGTSYALDRVRSVAAYGFAGRLAHATVRLFDENHESVWSRHLAGSNPTFDVGPACLTHARFVRVGFENKERTASGTYWHLGIAEVQVFGRPSAELGILDFSVSTDRIGSGESVTLSWEVEALDTLVLYPGGESVAGYTDGSGNGTLVLSPTNSTEYLLVGAAGHGTCTRAVAVIVDGESLPPRISEVVADNRLSLRDGRNNAPDWIELYNPNNEPLDMNGYALSDRADRPLKWVFPATNVPPHGHIVVFASGRNNPVDDEGWLHADFKLDADGESVVLTAADGVTTLDALADYPPQMEDLAYGRSVGGSFSFIEPTPLALNIASNYAGWLYPLDFSHERGFYTNGFSLAITNLNGTNSVVTYSLDGTEPSEPYSADLPIDETACVRAAVTREGYKSPRVQTHTYIFIDDVLTSPVMNQNTVQSYATRARQGLLDLPTFSVVVPDVPNHGSTNDYVEREASVELLWPDGYDKHIQSNCGFFRFGGAWTLMAKKNYRLKFRPEYGNRKLSAPLFNGFDRGFKVEESFDQIDLRGGGHDMRQRGFYMSARFTEDLMLDMGSINPHGRFAHLYINGTYWGMYHCRERLVDRFLADYLGGPAEDYVSVRGNDNVGSQFILGTPDPPKHQPWQYVLDNRGDYEKQAPFVDMSHLIDFNLMWTYGNCETEYRAAGPIAAGSGFKFWIGDADGFLRDNNKQPSNPGPAGIFGQLVSEGHEDFMTLLSDRVYKHFFNDGALTPSRNEKRLKDRMDEIYNSLVDECARWGERTPSNWESSAQNIYNTMFQTRTSELVSYLRNRSMYPAFDPPTLNRHGGSVSNGFEVTLASGSGTIYYTLDGSDPRLPGGTVSPTAQVYGSIVITSNTVLKTRVWTGSEWSAVREAHFLLADRRPVNTGDVVITEIHYDPADGDSFEFVEIQNVSTSLVDLTGATLSDGVDFWFPYGFCLAPGEPAVVVEDEVAFSNRYRSATSTWYHAGIDVAGQWSGALNDGGERIALSASNGTEVLAVTYDTGGDWPERAHGRGSSLELIDPGAVPAAEPELSAYLGNGLNWQSSSLFHGSPGRIDDFERAIVINEVLAHTDADTDWVELYNRGADLVNLSGLWLGDHYTQFQRFLIPTGTVVEVGEFVSFGAAQLGFAFSELGSDVLLVETAGTNIFRFYDTVDFPAVEREETFGRYRKSDGFFDFTELRDTTRDDTNALPRVGPVVFSEIMYRPATGMAEYVELVCITNAPIPLYDPAHPSNVWELSGAVSFEFPTGLVVNPCDVWIVCSTSPAAFRTAYGVDPAVPVYGPWTGALNNAGESVKLRRPGDPEPDGTVPYYRVDRVNYRPYAPWPAAAAAGNVSLERMPLEGYGNDPAWWQASAQGGTPGVPNGNRLPFVNTAGTNAVDEGGAVTVTVSVVDFDVPWQSVGVTTGEVPPASVFDSESGVLTWTTAEPDGPGEHALGFVGTDTACCPGVTTQRHVVTVREVNEAPVMQPIPSLRYPAGLTIEQVVDVTDADLPTQTLSFVAVGLPEGLTLDQFAGTIQGAGVDTGVYEIVVEVSDGQAPPLKATNVWSLEITERFETEAQFDAHGGTALRFPLMTGETYRAEYRESLTTGDWQTLELIAPATTNRIRITDPASTNRPRRFYRIRWLR